MKKEYEDKSDALMEDMKHDSEKTLDQTLDKKPAITSLCTENDWRSLNPKAEIGYLPDELLSFKRVRVVDVLTPAYLRNMTEMMKNDLDSQLRNLKDSATFRLEVLELKLREITTKHAAIQAMKKIRADSGEDTSAEDCKQIAVFGVFIHS